MNSSIPYSVCLIIKKKTKNKTFAQNHPKEETQQIKSTKKIFTLASHLMEKHHCPQQD